MVHPLDDVLYRSATAKEESFADLGPYTFACITRRCHTAQGETKALESDVLNRINLDVQKRVEISDSNAIMGLRLFEGNCYSPFGELPICIQ